MAEASVCYSNIALYIDGPLRVPSTEACVLTGEEIKEAVTLLWNVVRCSCGSMTLENGCVVTVDTVSHCSVNETGWSDPCLVPTSVDSAAWP
jgi:hypothetical protein